MPDLITTHEVADMLGVSSTRVRQLVTDRADFPAPAVVSSASRGIGTRYWRRADVVAWNASADRSRGRRARRARRVG